MYNQGSEHSRNLVRTFRRKLCAFLPGTVLLVLLAGLPVSADVIVLKNGRRIYAESVVERGGIVYYETGVGTIGISMKLVERIERGDSGATTGVRPPRSAKGPAGVSRRVERELLSLSHDDVKGVVQGGAVNFKLLSQFDREARQSRSPGAQNRAAAANVEVARHYLSKREFRLAGQSLQRALTFARNHPVLLLRLSALELEMQKYDQALQRLRPVLTNKEWAHEGYRLQGVIYYKQEEMPRAVKAWKQSLKLRPDPELERELASIEKEAEAAEGFKGESSRRFILRYDRETGTHSRFGRDVLSALEKLYSDIGRTFQYYPRERIVVLLYPGEAFRELTGAPSSVHGLFDGKIRVPAQGLTSIPPRLHTTLRHEVIHAFVYFKTRGKAPRWLQEGLAQYHAGQRPRVARSVFRPLFAKLDGTALRSIQAGFGGGPNQISSSYLASWVVVDTLEKKYGAAGRERFLAALRRGQSVEAALRSAFGIDLAQLDTLVLETLR